MSEKETSVDAQPLLDLTRSPNPTGKMLRHRRSLPVQLVKFSVFNLNILQMVFMGHHPQKD